PPHPSATLFPYTTLFRSVVRGECDPWHMLAGSSALVAEPGDELHMVAALLGRPRIEVEGITGMGEVARGDLREVLAQEVCAEVLDRKSTRLNSSHSQISY